MIFINLFKIIFLAADDFETQAYDVSDAANVSDQKYLEKSDGEETGKNCILSHLRARFSIPRKYLFIPLQIVGNKI